jgi:RecA/RadA recombinase
MFALIYRLRSLVEKIDPQLIVIDSIAGPLRGEASSENISRTPLLCDLGNLLKSLAAERGLAVLVTNHMSKLQFHGFVRTLGHAWAHIPAHCIEAKKTAMGDHYLRILKSPCIRRSDIQLTTSTE